MENFKEIAEKCLAGELSGTFVIDKGKNWHSSYLRKHYVIGRQMPGQYVLGPGIIYNEIGQCENRDKTRIIDFIPDNMQKKIEIDIPEGKVPVMEQTEKGVVITWKEKELCYSDIANRLKEEDKYIDDIQNDFPFGGYNVNSRLFYRKAEVYQKLINIRNYFGKPDGTKCGYYIYTSSLGFQVASTGYLTVYANSIVVFKEEEHAEQAIKMLGDELKYLFEPW